MPNFETPNETESVENVNNTTLTVFRVRHGETNYKEHRGHGEEIEFDLSEEGVETIRDSARRIEGELNKATDIVLVAHSPRQRTRDTAEIIKNYLEEQGFDVRADERSIQASIQGSDLLDDDGHVIPVNTPEHAEVFEELLRMPDLVSQHRSGNLPVIESQESVESRARKQMTRLTRFARHMKPPRGKRIVVIQAEHEETLDELLTHVSKGERGIIKESGPVRGEVIQLNIPGERKERESVVNIEARSLNAAEEAAEPDYATIHFDYLNREFIESGE